MGFGFWSALQSQCGPFLAIFQLWNRRFREAFAEGFITQSGNGDRISHFCLPEQVDAVSCVHMQLEWAVFGIRVFLDYRVSWLLLNSWLCHSGESCLTSLSVFA